jgi:hypothetical protein
MEQDRMVERFIQRYSYRVFEQSVRRCFISRRIVDQFVIALENKRAVAQQVPRACETAEKAQANEAWSPLIDTHSQATKE